LFHEKIAQDPQHINPHKHIEHTLPQITHDLSAQVSISKCICRTRMHTLAR